MPPPPAPIDIPEPVDARRSARRPPSPLRNSYTPDDDPDEGSQDGSDIQDDEDRPWSHHSASSSPSMTKMASNFAQRVGALVGSTGSRNSQHHLPSQAELEAEAERERERSRREAERILRREAEERKAMEDAVFAMINSSQQELTAPPARSQTMASGPSSSSSSPKEKEGWFAAVKNKLTPTKEPLTPAQQIIQDTKAKEKEKKKNKDKDQKDWPQTPSRKYSDPAFLNLASTASPEPVTPPRPVAQNGLMTPSPGRSIDSSRDAPPLYAQFNSQGILDVPDTLLIIARRFEKLERWTVSHVRALEDRMGDVERWLVDKEKEKEETTTHSATSQKSSFHSEDEEHDGRENELNEIREELMELQGRVGELGREMAKLMTAPLNLASGPARNAALSHSKYTSHSATAPVPTSVALSQPVATAPVQGVPPTPSSIGPRSLPTVPVSTPHQTTPVPARPKEASSPPSAQRSSSVLSNGSGRTRLPYPTGDYTSPPGSIPTRQDILSPTNSPPASLTAASRKRPMSISGLPSASSSFFTGASQLSGPSTPGLPNRQESPPIRALSPNSRSPAVSPVSGGQRQPNVSPTPRKRYTVALGQPISSASAESDEYDWRQRATFSASPVSGVGISGDNDDEDRSAASEDGDAEARAIGHSRDDTIGKSGSLIANPPTVPNDTLRRGNATTTPPKNSPGSNRIRAQSSYGPPSGFSLNMLSASSSPNASPTPIAPLRPRVRSKSIDRIGLGISIPNANGRFVDPLELRKQEQEPKTPKLPKFERGKKVPVNELVAFFDKDAQR